MLHQVRQLAVHWQLDLLRHELSQQYRAKGGASLKEQQFAVAPQVGRACLARPHLILSNSPLKTTMGCPPASATLLCSSWTAMSSFTLKLHSQQDSVSLAAPGSLQAASQAVGSMSGQMNEGTQRHQAVCEAGWPPRAAVSLASQLPWAAKHLLCVGRLVLCRLAGTWLLCPPPASRLAEEKEQNSA